MSTIKLQLTSGGHEFTGREAWATSDSDVYLLRLKVVSGFDPLMVTRDHRRGSFSTPNEGWIEDRDIVFVGRDLIPSFGEPRWLPSHVVGIGVGVDRDSIQMISTLMNGPVNFRLCYVGGDSVDRFEALMKSVEKPFLL